MAVPGHPAFVYDHAETLLCLLVLRLGALLPLVQLAALLAQRLGLSSVLGLRLAGTAGAGVAEANPYYTPSCPC